MVRLVIGKMNLQQLQMTIDRLVEFQLPHEKMQCAIPPAAVARVRSAIS